jgi:alkylmercury lyase
MSQQSFNELAEQLCRSLCSCTTRHCDLVNNDLGLCRTLIRLLAKGQPVSADALAQASDRSRGDVLSVIRTNKNVELDDRGYIVGAGLSLRPTPHRLLLADGRTLYAWCALDALMYPPFLDMTVRVESPCFATGTLVEARVFVGGVETVVPPEAVVSIVMPDGEYGVRQGFCNHVHFFRSAQAAMPWSGQHPSALLLSVSDAYLLGRELARTGDCR